MSDKDIWEKVLELAEEEKKQITKEEGEMTISEFCEISGMTRSSARRFLDKQVENGEISVRELPLGGGTRVYKPV